MPSFSEGYVLPAPSQADRKIANASKWHCTAFAVYGEGAGVRKQAESKLELDHLAIQAAEPDVAEVREQELFTFGWRDEQRHFFDMVVVKTSGERVACTVKPTPRISEYARCTIWSSCGAKTKDITSGFKT